MHTIKLHALLSALAVVALATGCPGDDGGSAATEATAGDDGDDDVAMTLPPMTTLPDPTPGMQDDTTDDGPPDPTPGMQDDTTDDGPTTSTTDGETTDGETTETTDTGDPPVVCMDVDVPRDTCTDEDPDDCVCLGCNDDESCEVDDDCTCADCAVDAVCIALCQNDGVCSVANESCKCPDCAGLPECASQGSIEGWNCAQSLYGDGDCTCGCGIQDVDCDDLSIDSCINCSGCALGGTCADRIDPEDNTQCVDQTPAGWFCNPAFFGDGDCDCGCGIQDEDCDDLSVDSCEFCLGCSGNAIDECPSIIDPDNNAVCFIP